MTTRSIRRGVIGLAASGGVAVAILAGGATVLAADHAVDISGFAFSPRELTVAVGDTVTWANADAQGHTATADDGTFDTGTIAGNSAKAVTLTTAGTFAYHCRIHPAMTASLVVTAAAGSPPPTDTVDPVSASTTADPMLAIGLALAWLAGLALGRRQFRGRDKVR